MAVYEPRYQPVLVYGDTADDLKDVMADVAVVKRGIVLATGKEYILFPGADTWHENGGNGTIPAKTPPSPDPGGTAEVGTAIVGTSTVGSEE